VSLRHPLVARRSAFYLSAPRELLLSSMPPQLQKAVKGPGPVGATAAWDPRANDLPAEITKLLDHIGGVLADADRADLVVPDDGGPPSSVLLPGSEVFRYPPGHSVSLGPGSCIVPRRELATEVKGVELQNKTYLQVKVGKLSNKSYIWAGVHQIILWACYGPPPDTIQDPVAMHVCTQPAGAMTCLNAEHMVWGERARNIGRWDVLIARAAEEARARMLEQRRFSFW
jgi:hypothetical protein